MVNKNGLFGRIGEKLVEIELIKRNIDCWQLTANNPYFDLIVDTKNGLKKIQVKTSNESKKGKYQCNLQNCAGDYDYLIFVTISKSNKLKFYIIPVENIIDNTGINLGKTSNKFLEFENKWEQFLK